ncbi:MAG: DUF4230 domain-containing protein [Oscillospiraceae bacterium]|nr:DUF4230 domain-containing protein [Oscillospiraceae bacterium]
MEKRTDRSTPPRISVVIIILIAVLSLIIGVLVTVLIMSRNDRIQRAITIGGVIEPIQELTTVKYTYDAVSVAEKKSLLLKEQQLIVYSSCIKAGYDLSEIEINEDTFDKVINITMPELEILSHERPHDLRSYDTKKALFVDIETEDGMGQIEQDMMLKEEALLKDEGFIKTARSQAELAITSLLKATPETQEYKVTFTYK